MSTIQTSHIAADNPNVWEVVLVIPQGKTIWDEVNIPLLDEQVRAVIATGRLWSVNEYQGTAVRFGFVSPPTESEQNTVDGKVAAHNPAGHTQEQQDAIDRGVDWADLRAQAVAMIEQGNSAITAIDANLATINTIESNVTAATTLGQLKTALAPLPNVLRGILNRQAGIITNFQRVLKALRWLVPGA